MSHMLVLSVQGGRTALRSASKMPEPMPGIHTALVGEVVLSHFTDEETEAQRVGVTCPGSTDKQQS